MGDCKNWLDLTDRVFELCSAEKAKVESMVQSVSRVLKGCSELATNEQVDIDVDMEVKYKALVDQYQVFVCGANTIKSIIAFNKDQSDDHAANLCSCLGELLGLCDALGPSANAALITFKDDKLQPFVQEYVAKVYDPRKTAFVRSLLGGREFKGRMLPTGGTPEEFSRYMQHKPLPLEQTKRLQAMANQLGQVKDAAFFEIASRLDYARVACASFVLAQDPDTFDVMTMPAKFVAVKKQTDRFLMVANAMLQQEDVTELANEVKELDLKNTTQHLTIMLTNGLAKITKGQLHALQCSDKEVSDLLPENWRVHVIDEPDEKWIMENLLHNSLSTKVDEVWARSFATYKNIKDSGTMHGHTHSEKDLASKLLEAERNLSEARKIVAVCVICECIYVRMPVTIDKKQLAKDTRKKLQVMEASPPVELLKRLTHVSTL